MTRLLTAAVLAPLLWLAIKRAPAWLFVVGAMLVILGASWECYRMLRGRGGEPLVGLGLGATTLLLGSFAGATGRLEPVQVLLGAVLLATGAAMGLRASPERMLASILETLFPIAFIGLTMGHVIALRVVPDADGSDRVLLLFLCVILGDTAAYYVGTALGRHRLAPTISPRKSWEGMAGALAGSLAAALLAHFWFFRGLPLVHALALGPLLGLAGVLGDLAESLVKRACRVKDSSQLLPGHGGWLDRTDSLIFAAPVLYYYHLAWLRSVA